MWSQRTLLALVIGLCAATAASAQPPSGLRWPGSGPAPLGLQPGVPGSGVHCGQLALACDTGAAVVPLYGNKLGTRSLDMQVVAPAAAGPARLLNPAVQGLNVSLVGKAHLPYDLGLYGRLGTTLGGPPALAGSLANVRGKGVSYGIGLSWDFSERGSAVVGWDSYDFQTLAGERDVRATSLGLQWRY